MAAIISTKNLFKIFQYHYYYHYSSITFIKYFNIDFTEYNISHTYYFYNIIKHIEYLISKIFVCQFTYV